MDDIDSGTKEYAKDNKTERDSVSGDLQGDVLENPAGRPSLLGECWLVTLPSNRIRVIYSPSRYNRESEASRASTRTSEHSRGS